jgi:hypothetical protein
MRIPPRLPYEKKAAPQIDEIRSVRAPEEIVAQRRKELERRATMNK